MSEQKRGSSGKLYLVAGLLLLVSAAAVAAMVPLADCPACEGKGTISVTLSNTKLGKIGCANADCPNCGKTGKVTLLKKLQIPRIDKTILSGGEAPR
jgi:Zn ribbon nucleic-acid-binding protein